MRNTHSFLGILVIGFIYLQLSVSAQSLPGVVINEYLSDPIGTDIGLEWIELFNPTCSAIDITGYELTASSGNFYVMPSLLLAPRSYVVIHWRKDGANTQTDLFTSAAVITSNIGNTSGYVALFNSATHSKSTIIDYLEYGVGAQSWEQTAFDAGIWLKEDFITISGEGKTNGRINNGADTNTSTDFVIYDVPTIGSENSPSIDPCMIESPSPTEITPTPTSLPTATPTNIPILSPVPTQTIIPTPSVSLTIEVTPAITVTPTPILSPTSLPTITPIPTVKLLVTPTPNPRIEYVLPTELKNNENMLIKVLIVNAKPQTEYAIKFEAGINNSWTYGKTFGNDNNLLAWNANWKLFPTITTNYLGEAEKLITVQIINIPGTIDTRIKLADLVNGKYYYSSIKTVNVRSIIPSETPTPVVKLTPIPTVISPMFELKTIKEVKSLSESTVVKVQGWVSVDRNIFGAESFYIQDESAGIKVTLSDTVNININKGDLLTIIGELGFPYNEAVIKIKNALNINVEKANHVFNLQKVVTGNVGEQTEGNLIGIIGKVVETSGSTFFVDDGSGKVKVYIKDTTQIDKPYMRQEYYVSVIGIVSQYKDEYRVLPRYNSDLYVSKSPISNQVLGAIDELPNTGSWDLVINLIFVVIGITGLRISFLSQRFMLRNKKCIVE